MTTKIIFGTPAFKQVQGDRCGDSSHLPWSYLQQPQDRQKCFLLEFIEEPVLGVYQEVECGPLLSSPSSPLRKCHTAVDLDATISSSHTSAHRECASSLSRFREHKVPREQRLERRVCDSAQGKLYHYPFLTILETTEDTQTEDSSPSGCLCLILLFVY